MEGRICWKGAMSALVVIAILSNVSAQIIQKEAKSYEIKLHSRMVIPEYAENYLEKVHIDKTFKRNNNDTNSIIHVLVQFNNFPKDLKENIKDLDITKLEYIPDNTWVVSMPYASASKLSKLDAVRWIGDIEYTDKIAPQIKDGVHDWAKNNDGAVKIEVFFFKDTDLKSDIIELTPYIEEVILTSDIGNSVLITCQESMIEKIAEIESVKWINEIPGPQRLFLAGVRENMDVNRVQTNPYNLSGDGILISEWDGGNVDNNHTGLKGRIAYGEGESANNVSDHATHVAGIIAGNGSLSTNLEYRGIAPKSGIISWKYWGSITEATNEYNDSINNWGIEVSTNSWGYIYVNGIGCENLGNYTDKSAFLDGVVRGSINKSIPIVWAVGNDRVNVQGNCGFLGYTYGTIDVYASAKNTISVGSINSNDDSMTSYSGWGPTDDGRIKPDLVAPGDESFGRRINSTIGDYIINETERNCSVGNIDDYCYPYDIMGGTSMATPAVTGTVALMKEQYNIQYPYSTILLPSTIKDILIHTVEDLGNSGPDYQYGWGKVNATAAIDWIIEGDFLERQIDEELEYHIYYVNVSASDPELKVTLVWDDEPASVYSGDVLVNDLELYLVDPSGRVYYTWKLDPSNPSNPASNGTDHKNNIEQVYVPNPEDGWWTIQVAAFTLNNPQNYSLSYKGLGKMGYFEVQNDGDANLTVSNINSTATWITDVYPTLFTLEPGQNKTVGVIIDEGNQEDIGSLQTDITIFSNDPDNPEKTIPLVYQRIKPGYTGVTPPSSGDWVIDEYTAVWYNDTDVDGNLDIQGGYTLFVGEAYVNITGGLAEVDGAISLDDATVILG